MHERMRTIRKENGLTQAEFGNAIGLSRDMIANLENGRANPSEIQIRMICRTFNVNEIWLRTGEGEMTAPVTEDEQIAAYVADVLGDAPDSFRRRLLAAQASWTPEMWDALKQICESLK